VYQYVPSSNPSNWHTENPGSATTWLKWSDWNGDTTGSPVTLSQIALDNPNATVSRVYLTEGMGNSYYVSKTGTVAWVSDVTIGEKTYVFVTKNHCDNDGWKLFDSPSFGNQGQCRDFMDNLPKYIHQNNNHGNKHHGLFND